MRSGEPEEMVIVANESVSRDATCILVYPQNKDQGKGKVLITVYNITVVRIKLRRASTTAKRLG